MNNANYYNKIGIIGGGQLGKMMILEAKRLGFYTAILDPYEKCPAHSIADMHIVADFDDYEALNTLAGQCQVITYEFEHIHADALIEINASTPVYPSPDALKVIQNKYDQKTALKKSGLPVPVFRLVSSVDDIVVAGEEFGFPLVLKTCTGGYDGKGNAFIKDVSCARQGFKALGEAETPLMVEQFIDFTMEISVVACRGINGETVLYPTCKNIHKDSILDMTLAPAPITPETSELARGVARKVMEAFEGVGIFCVEFFVLRDGSVMVNEVAPRPHNSGHYTIEACVTNQFENHIRTIAGLPPGKTDLLQNAVMCNILGECGYGGKAIVSGLYDTLMIPGAKVHIYGKEYTAPKRKMGHITVTAEDSDTALKNAIEARGRIKVIGEEVLEATSENLKIKACDRDKSGVY